MKTRPTRQQRIKKRAALIEKHWGNAYMGSERPGDQVPNISFRQYQLARREAWEHGMKVGFAAGIDLAHSAGAEPK